MDMIGDTIELEMQRCSLLLDRDAALLAPAR